MGLGKQHHMFSKDPSCSYMEDGVVGERRDGRRETHTRPGGCRNGPSKDSRQMKGREQVQKAGGCGWGQIDKRKSALSLYY